MKKHTDVLLWLLLFVLTLLGILLISHGARATLNEVDRADIWNRQLLSNGGFENGRQRWTASGGTFSTATSGSNLLQGQVSVTWDSNSASQTLTSTAVTIPNGWYGRNGVATCLILTPSGTATHTLSAFDGTNTLSSATITSSTTPARTSVNFIFPSSGSLSLRLTSVNANEPLIAIDSCFLGPAEGYNIDNISEAIFIGAANYLGTASCTWARAAGSMGDFGTTAACPAPTIESNPGPGPISTTDADLPQFTVNNLPPGQYLVVGKATIQSAGGGAVSIRWSDGTTNCPVSGNAEGSNASAGEFSCVFSYTTTANRTFKMQGYSSSGNANIVNSDANAYGVQFRIYRFPSSNEQAFRPDQLPASWNGFHDSDCSWTRTNTAYGDPGVDATCTFTQTSNLNFGTVASNSSGGASNTLPGIVFTPARAGRYFVCANFAHSTSSGQGKAQLVYGGSTVIAQGYSGSTTILRDTMCGIVVAASTASVTVTIQIASSSGTSTLAGSTTAPANRAIDWSIFSLDQSFPAPVLTGSVTSGSNGAIRFESAQITSAGVVTEVGSSDWINGNCSIASTSQYTCTFNSGVFTATPSCVVTNVTTSDFGVRIRSQSSSAVTYETLSTSAGTNSAQAANLVCMGAR